MEILKVDNIFKQFGNFKAVSGISFSVEQGAICGILGPNGAGKTTTIRMITNILMPDSGKITIFGDQLESGHQNDMGYLPEERGLYKKVKVIDQLVYFGRLKGLTINDSKTKAKYWLSRLEAESWENKKIQELSKGMQQKVQFITTIMHNPRLLILDEPFSGFDPINTELFKKIIQDLRADGTTILLSTHIMEQAEQLCDSINLINKGKLLLSGSLRDVKKNYGKDTFIIEFEGSDEFLNKFTDLKFINRASNRAEFRITDPKLNPNDVLKAALDFCTVYKYEVSEPSLNELFIDVVSKQVGEENEN